MGKKKLNEKNFINFLEKYQEKLRSMQNMTHTNEFRYLQFLAKKIKENVKLDGYDFDPNDFEMIQRYKTMIEERLAYEITHSNKWKKF